MRAAALPVLLAIATAACAGSSSGEGSVPPDDDGAYVTDSVTDSDRMSVEPPVVAPGGSARVRFPAGDDRGPGFVLERRGDSGWVWEWALTSDPEAVPTVVAAEEFRRSRMEWLSGPAFDGPGTHELPVPGDAEPGQYRVCTVDVDPVLCAEFRVASDG